MKNKIKIAIVNQRYGTDVNGGSEYYTKLLSEHLSKYYAIDILTTTAIDYITWKNYYKPGTEKINNILIHRFKVEHTRNKNVFNMLYRLIRWNIPIISSFLERYWTKIQGPYSPDCIKYINDNKDEYDVFIFVTYLYYLTAEGIKNVYHKSILIPTAHDEIPIRFKLYKNMFKMVAAIVYLTEEERKFVNNFFHNENVLNDTIGIGIEIPDNIDKKRFKVKFNAGDYIIYVGRVNSGKGCNVLFEDFLKYKKETNNNLKLVVIGKASMEIPKNKDILYLGFVSDQDKYEGIAGARALVLPSQYESLSISVLESMAMGIPVLVNGKSTVLREHCHKSNAGLYYNSYGESAACLDIICYNEKKYDSMSKNGKEYIKKYYSWTRAIESWKIIIDKVLNNSINVK